MSDKTDSVKSELYDVDQIIKERGEVITGLLVDLVKQSMPELMLRGKSTFDVNKRDCNGNIEHSFELVITKTK